MINNIKKVTIFDGYVDEPTCLGVPPFISTYPRYIAGAIWKYNKKIDLKYISIDQLRNNSKYLDYLEKSDVIFVIAGSTVPGKYLLTYPASPQELKKYFDNIKSIKILVGPAGCYGFPLINKILNKNILDIFELKISGDCEVIVSDIFKNIKDLDLVDISRIRESSHDINDYAIKGSNIVRFHQNFNNQLIVEIETYRGCSRSIVGGCSFCSESIKGRPDFRPISDILSEIKSLYEVGIRNFRLGNQPCIFSFMAKNSSEDEFPRPNPPALLKLFKGIRFVAPNLDTLHIDNANPGILSRFPSECLEIAKTIIKYHTPGDVAAFGVESIDPFVIKKNNLKADSEDVYNAIKLLNDVGSNIGINGMPELLPGLNFLFGLIGETKNTYIKNFEFLEKIVENKLMIRRLNLRQVIPIPGTQLYETGRKNIKKFKSEFKNFKIKIRNNVEMPLLKQMLPIGNILYDVHTEIHKGNLTFGRQVGSYPLLISIPDILPLNIKLNVKLVDYGYRSVTAIPYPLNINIASRTLIKFIPNIGKKRVGRILLNRPFSDNQEFINSIDDKDTAIKILEYINII